MQIEPTRGGFTRPVSAKQFILSYLAENGEAYIAQLHRAYKAELKRLAEENPKRRRVTRRGRIQILAYHTPRYHNFARHVQLLAGAELIEFSGKEEESDAAQFQEWDGKPLRRFYRLKTTGV